MVMPTRKYSDLFTLAIGLTSVIMNRFLSKLSKLTGLAEKFFFKLAITNVRRMTNVSDVWDLLKTYIFT